MKCRLLSIEVSCYEHGMTLPEAITQMMMRPDFVAVLDPDRIISIAKSGSILDETKPYKAFPRFRAQELTAIMWQVFTREQLQERTAQIEEMLRQRGIAVNDG